MTLVRRALAAPARNAAQHITRPAGHTQAAIVAGASVHVVGAIPAKGIREANITSTTIATVSPGKRPPPNPEIDVAPTLEATRLKDNSLR